MKTSNKYVTIPQLLDALMATNLVIMDENLRKSRKAFIFECFLMDKETDDPEQEQAMAQMRIDAYAVRVAFENVPAVTDMQRLNTLYDKFYLSAMYLLESMDPPLVNMFNPAFEE